MNYAEAKIEANDIDATGLDAINQVRARAYGVDISDVGNYPEIMTTSQSELRDIVRNERSVELALEGSRWYDIRRWQIAETVRNEPIRERTWRKLSRRSRRYNTSSTPKRMKLLAIRR